jgi:hypothetical protein
MARSRPASQSTSLHGDALAGIWSWALAPSPAAALRRRIFLWLLSAAFAVLLITFRAQSTSIWTALFTPASLGHLLVTALAFWLALSAAAAILQSLFPTITSAAARRHILRRAFGGRYETLHTYGSQSFWETDQSALARSGGPGWLKVHLENAAITERADGSARVLAPGPRPVLLEGFERLRAVLHLKEQVLTLNVWARSRDGIRVRVEGARLVFGLLRSKREPSLQQPFPFDPQAALDLVYDQCIEGSANRLARPAGNVLAEQGQALFERQLQEFIGRFNLGELLSGPMENSAEGLSGQLLLARDKLREAFITRSRDAAAALGLQINWVDIGTWRLDERARAAIAGSERQAPVELADQEGELTALIEHLLPDNLEKFSQAWIDEALANFSRLFADLQSEYDDLKNESEPQLESVIRFLNLLTKQRTPKKS